MKKILLLMLTVTVISICNGQNAIGYSSTNAVPHREVYAQSNLTPQHTTAHDSILIMQWLDSILGNIHTENLNVVKLEHKYYTNYYDTILKAPIYSTYLLTKYHLIENVKRSPQFYHDPMVCCQATDQDYARNGKYDKGHLSPDADFRFDSTAEHEIMYCDNTAPQISRFNRGIWKELEMHVRNICNQYDSVTVWTGCIYSTSSLNGIRIPSNYWKVIKYQGKYSAWMGNNQENESNDINTMTADLFVIKELTGIEF